MPLMSPDPASPTASPADASTQPTAAELMARIETLIKACEAIKRENDAVLSDALALRIALPMDLRSCMAQLGVVIAHTRVAYLYFRGVSGEERLRLLKSLSEPWR